MVKQPEAPWIRDLLNSLSLVLCMRNGDLAPSEEHGTHTEKTSKGHLTFCSPSEREDLRMAPVVVSPLPAAPLGACAVNEDIVLGVLSNAA